MHQNIGEFMHQKIDLAKFCNRVLETRIFSFVDGLLWIIISVRGREFGNTVCILFDYSCLDRFSDHLYTPIAFDLDTLLCDCLVSGISGNSSHISQ